MAGVKLVDIVLVRSAWQTSIPTDLTFVCTYLDARLEHCAPTDLYVQRYYEVTCRGRAAGSFADITPVIFACYFGFHTSVGCF